MIPYATTIKMARTFNLIGLSTLRIPDSFDEKYSLLVDQNLRPLRHFHLLVARNIVIEVLALKAVFPSGLYETDE
jgi:hypothetical protein